jgi:teichuronic acid biosynthesis glycosyltransferase TuaC
MSRKINNLCIISAYYPTEQNPVFSFVHQLVCELVDNKINCMVISPYNKLAEFTKKTNYYPKYKRVIVTKNGNIFEVNSPNYVSFSNKIFDFNTSLLTYYSFKKTVIEEYKKSNFKADAFYGHFVYTSGLCAVDMGQLFNKPSFIANGESSINNFLNIKKSILVNKLNLADGIISVSSENKKKLLKNELISDPEKVEVFPNGIDNEKFYKINKSEARQKLGIDQKKFIVISVGHFNERKGTKILSDVLDKLNDVYSIFIGSGVAEPKCKNILFKGRVQHEQVCLYLNAADVFVLPTKAEGCSNAIIEAMACGLPIISSNQDFNNDILNHENSIRINVENEDAISMAIKQIRNDHHLRKRLSEGALKSAIQLNIKDRTKKIISFMNLKLDLIKGIKS